MRGLRPVTFAVLVVGFAGCSDPYAGRYAVSGKVTLEGQPLKEGLILFSPEGNIGTDTGAVVRNGKYQIVRESGLKPGKYLVRLTAGDGKTPDVGEDAAAPGGTNIISVDLIPEEWNKKSEKVFEVKASGPNEFNIDVPVAIDPKTKKPKK